MLSLNSAIFQARFQALIPLLALDRFVDVSVHLEPDLDAMDGDPDLEPYLAGFEGGPDDDRERDLDLDEDDEGERLEGDDNCDEEDGADDEPSLGWSNPIGWRIGDKPLAGWSGSDGD